MKSPDQQMRSHAHVQRASEWLPNRDRKQPQISDENLPNESAQKIKQKKNKLEELSSNYLFSRVKNWNYLKAY